MIRLDSTKMTFPIEGVTKKCSLFDKRGYKTKDEKGKNGKIYYKERLSDNELGIKSISINNNQSVTIETSAKLLGADYLEGVNKNTFSQFIDKFNERGLLILDPNIIYDEAFFKYLHVTDNIKPRNIKDCLFALSQSAVNRKYLVTPYNKKGGEATGWNVRGVAKSNKFYFTGYDKLSDVSRNIKDNKILMTYGFNPNEAKGILRIENKLMNGKSIRNAFMISDKRIKVKEVLESNLQVNHKAFSNVFSKQKETDKVFLEVTANQKQMILELLQGGYKMNSIKKEIAERIMISAYGIEGVKALLYQHYPNNVSRDMKPFYNTYRQMQNEILGDYKENINEIQHLLKAC